MLRTSTILKAIFERREPVLEVGSYGGYVLTYPGIEAYISWRVKNEESNSLARESARENDGLELPEIPIIEVGMWYGGGSEGITVELAMNFLERIREYGDCIVTAVIINEKLAMLFKKLGGLVSRGKGYLYVQNDRPSPIPEEWWIDSDRSPKNIVVEALLRQVSTYLAA